MIKFINVPTSLDNLKIKVNDWNVSKLQTVSIDLKLKFLQTKYEKKLI